MHGTPDSFYHHQRPRAHIQGGNTRAFELTFQSLSAPSPAALEDNMRDVIIHWNALGAGQGYISTHAAVPDDGRETQRENASRRATAETQPIFDVHTPDRGM